MKVKLDWIECDMALHEFESAGLCNVGTVFQTSDDQYILIGSINEDTGTCNCCAMMQGSEPKIKKYAIVPFDINLAASSEAGQI